jgi:DNA-binding transcriptional MerR regulator
MAEPKTEKIEKTGLKPGLKVEPIQVPDRLFFRIGEVAALLKVKPHVLRYWETEFPGVAPTKSKTGQRVYQRAEVETLALVRHLLYVERYSIEGARRRIRELKREGEFKASRSAAVQDSDSVSAEKFGENLGELKAVLKELRTELRTPLSQLFTA